MWATLHRLPNADAPRVCVCPMWLHCLFVCLSIFRVGCDSLKDLFYNLVQISANQSSDGCRNIKCTRAHAVQLSIDSSVSRQLAGHFGGAWLESLPRFASCVSPVVNARMVQSPKSHRNDARNGFDYFWSGIVGTKRIAVMQFVWLSQYRASLTHNRSRSGDNIVT